MEHRQRNPTGAISSAATEQAAQLARQGKLPEALKLLEGAEGAVRAQKDFPGLVRLLNDKAGTLRFLGRFADAERTLTEVEQLARQIKDDDSLQTALGNRAVLLREMADQGKDKRKLELALELNREKLRMCTEQQDANGIQFAIGTEALVQRDLGDLTQAGALWQRQAAMLRKLEHLEELGRCLLNIAMWKIEIGRPFHASEELDEAEQIAEKLRSVPLKEGASQVRLRQHILTHDERLSMFPKAMLLSDRAHELMEAEDFGAAEKAFGEVIDLPGVPLEISEVALDQRGFARFRLGRYEDAFSDYSALIAHVHIHPMLKAEAYQCRSELYRMRGEPDGQLSDLRALLALPEVPSETRARAAQAVGEILLGRHECEAAVEVSGITVREPEADVTTRARAHRDRGVGLLELGRISEALEDLTAAITLEEAPRGIRANCYLLRGMANCDLEAWDLSVADCTAALDLGRGDAPTEGAAQLQRGRAHQGRRRREDAHADFTAALNVPGLPDRLRGECLFRRAFNLEFLDRDLEALDDYETILSSEGVAARWGPVVAARLADQIDVPENPEVRKRLCGLTERLAELPGLPDSVKAGLRENLHRLRG